MFRNYNNLSYQEIEHALTLITDDISERERVCVKSSGFYTNSVVSGFYDGSLSVITDDERLEIFTLKQELMSRSANERIAARNRILARRRAKN